MVRASGSKAEFPNALTVVGTRVVRTVRRDEDSVCNGGCIPLRGCARDGSFTASRPRASTGTSRAKTNPRAFVPRRVRPPAPSLRALETRASRRGRFPLPLPRRSRVARARVARASLTMHASRCAESVPRRHREARDDDARLARGRPRLVASLGWKSSATATESRATRDARVDERRRARDGREGDGDGDPRRGWAKR